MRMIVTHLTRMRARHVCVAGVSDDFDTDIRPVIPHQRLTGNVLTSNGGVFDMAMLVNLGSTRPCGSAPEVEDVAFTPTLSTALRPIAPEHLWQILTYVSASSMAEIFGEQLVKRGQESAAVDADSGNASLGHIESPKSLSLYPGLNHRGQRTIRLKMTDSNLGRLDLSVTDLRLVDDDHITILDDMISSVGDRIRRGVPVVISVGLTRAYPQNNLEEPSVHWLQVNNIHLEDDPCWRLLDRVKSRPPNPDDSGDLEDLPF
jgi:hypothetical protein